jgi:2,3-bisphosphoglycerate-independent phosphoglycerate mutase
MKYILLVGDGMGDLPIPELDDKTPLEAARKPVMDRLAEQGELLQTRTVPEGYPPGSDVANLSLLGYAPEDCYTGRGPLEAAAMGVDIGEDELAFRCNLVNVERDGERIIMRDYSGGHISTKEAGELITALQEGCATGQLRFFAGVSYRHLVLYQGGIGELETVPPHDYTDQDVTRYFQQYLQLDQFAQLLEKAEQILASHPVNARRIEKGELPVNMIWLWGEGRAPAMTPLTNQFGLTGSLISAVDLLKGLGVYSGLEVINVEGATGYLDTNYEGKAEAAIDALQEQDFVLVHVEAPDEAGHQGRVEEKVQAIEEFDSRIVAPIVAAMDAMNEAYRLVVTMDHFTPLAHRTHTDWPVPMVLYDSRGVRKASDLTYCESNARHWAANHGLELGSGPAFFRYFLERDG